MLLVNLLRWQNVVDFIVLSVAFYLVLLWAKQTRALHLALLMLASTPPPSGPGTSI